MTTDTFQPGAAGMIPTGDATAMLPLPGDAGEPITVIGTPTIRGGFDDVCLKQAINSRMAPGVDHLVLNPDAHLGYGALWAAR